ncbi:DUF2844 domain-containing protein [Paraburkholderia phosphatilytica]|uniref:DUF2844 domain-containing protein n=1 Tax=Paraburkholderia phosphatilytica TaxID=2282883 RepID=UPI001F0C6F6E|nr:DUF2844 domain-containing protein [Paraburkholderia phosphatilytica]
MSSRHLHRMHAGRLIQRALTVSSGAALLFTVFSSPAHAELGGSPITPPAGATVSSSQAVSHAASTTGTSAASSSSGSTYTVRTITLGSGTVVREYVSQAGVVFGVAWDGPQMPPLSSLLGSSNFSTYVAGVQAAHKLRGRGPGDVSQDGLVVHSGGHMGAFSGQAWLQQALPSGVSTSDIQ